jgi:HemY protein
MRALAWLLAVCAAAVALALFGRLGEGVVVLVWPPWRMELSMLLAAIALVAAFALLYAALGLVGHTLALPAKVAAYRERRRREHAQRALAVALQAYYEGRYARAEKEAAFAWEAHVAPGVAALLAARAAHQLREFERRERWLERAAEAGESLHAATLLTQAELALEEHDYIGARNALTSLHGAGPRHIAGARMLLRAERGARNWEGVLRLANTLGKRGAISPTLAAEHRVQADIELLKGAAGDRDALAARWRRIAAEDQVHPRVAAAAARDVARAGDLEFARDILEQSLAAEWSPNLVTLYGELPAGEAQAREREARARIERAERWLPGHSDDAQLLATLGRLCAAAGLWGKAARYLETSVSFEDSRAARLELARLAEREGRAAEAHAHFRRAAELT